MEIYLLKAFDISCFRVFTPTPAGFTSEEAAKAFCRKHNASEGDVCYAYKKAIISEISAKDMT